MKQFSPKELEEKVLDFWRENKIFEKSVEKNPPQKNYVFFDGPPFATGLPHYGHILASIIKDAIPRYQTMRGKRVERRWGWDCHGLPIENEIEKDLGLKTKKDIEKIGIKKFNEAARKKVLIYASEWKKIIPRIGRWVDMGNDYKTMDADYMESVLWVFKQLYQKNLIYEGYKAMHICPRCGTTLSNFEVTLNYKDIADISATVKFELEQLTTNNQQPTTYLLAWTTTPWTLPGNVALAVNPKIDYVKFSLKNYPGISDGIYIVSQEDFDDYKEEIEKNKSQGVLVEVIGNFRGKDLVGKKYKPLFNYYASDKNLKNKTNGWKIYAADFVTSDEGTGIVHIAPAFGEDDLALGQKENLPFIQHVGEDGAFKPEVKDFKGMLVKPKENPQATDVEIIKWLAKEGKLFKKAKIIHSYPFCWRCDTPLLNYAASSWFVKVTDLKTGKGGLLDNNSKINWIPEYLKDGRFGNWLKDARDWAISRSRYWGAPIPVWRCGKCKKEKIIGSLEDIEKYTKKSGNNYFVMRHGEAESNAKGFVSTDFKKDNNHLTKKGKDQAVKSAKTLLRQLKNKKIDLILSSDFIRAKETVEIVAEQFGLVKSKIIYDERLREIRAGIFEGKSWDDYRNYFSNNDEKFYKIIPGGENLQEVKNRVTEFLYDVEKKYSGKTILIISHECPIWLIIAGAQGADVKKTLQLNNKPRFLETGEIRELNFIPFPHNDNFELDFHRPYIDEIIFNCDCGGKMKRVPDVFDCWLESGAMPYGQAHYPFAQINIDNKQKNADNICVNPRFDPRQSASLPVPAEFIAEGIDQTRGWFYTLLVLSTGLFNKPAYKNVITNGIILAEDGQKMSKRLQNYPDPMELVNKYGADALRLYLLSSSVVRAESLNFSEKGVDEIYKKNILRLWNVLSFYNLYVGEDIRDHPLIKAYDPRQSASILDKWILARLKQLVADVSEAMDNYELDKATRPFEGFIEDLSTWYLRRSRERFKNEGKNSEAAKATTNYVLIETAKTLAPFAPFIAEYIYQQLTTNNQQLKVESVHLEDFPMKEKITKDEVDLLDSMVLVRKIASMTLEERAKAGIKVRQPLNQLKVKSEKLKGKEELLEILAEEVNVKEIIFDDKIQNDVELDVKITPELKNEGILRDITRVVQDLRKRAGLQPKDKISLFIEAEGGIKKVIEDNLAEFKKTVGVEIMEYKKAEKLEIEAEIEINNQKFWAGIKK